MFLLGWNMVVFLTVLAFGAVDVLGLGNRPQGAEPGELLGIWRFQSFSVCFLATGGRSWCTRTFLVRPQGFFLGFFRWAHA